jgi:putative redox protein
MLPPIDVTLSWTQDLQFTGGKPGGPSVTVDGDGAAAPSPMQQLLLAAAGCSGADVVGVLAKMQVELRELRVDVSGTRREEWPRRFLAIHFEYRVGGTGLDEAKARRAIDLSHEKYCSVIHSLAPDMRITYGLTLV